MELALDFLIILMVELPIIMLFFKQKKRVEALGYATLINISSWAIVHILKISTDFNLYYTQGGVIVFEAIALIIFTRCGWKKGITMSIIANIASFYLLKAINLNPEMFQTTSNIIIH